MKVIIIKQGMVPPSKHSHLDPWIFPDKREIELECNGTGTNVDPIQIDNILPIPKRVTFRNHKLYFFIKNIKLKKLGIDNCENLTFGYCTLSLIKLQSSKNIKFNNTIINRNLRLKDCSNITFENSFIKDTILFKSNDNILKESYFVKIIDWMSKNNIYEKNKIKTLETNVKEKNFHQRNTFFDNKFKTTIYKINNLFPKAIIKAMFSIFFSIFLIVILVKGFNLMIGGLILGFFFILILWIYIPEYYYKIKLRILSKR